MKKRLVAVLVVHDAATRHQGNFVEDLYLAICELVEHHGCQPREIRRFVNQA